MNGSSRRLLALACEEPSWMGPWRDRRWMDDKVLYQSSQFMVTAQHSTLPSNDQVRRRSNILGRTRLRVNLPASRSPGDDGSSVISLLRGNAPGWNGALVKGAVARVLDRSDGVESCPRVLAVGQFACSLVHSLWLTLPDFQSRRLRATLGTILTLIHR